MGITEIQGDFDTIMTDLPYSTSVTWVRNASTEDEMGRENARSETFSATIDIIMQPVTEKDRDIIALGISVSGHMKAYAKRKYSTSAGDKSIKTGDFITSADSSEYIVEKIIGKFGGQTDGFEVFRKLILRQVGN